METHLHNRNMLFAQLGLPAEDAAIDRFITRHGPLPEHVRLSEAPFWSPAQASFLREGVQVDADWAEVIDQLNRELHAPDRSSVKQS